MIKADEIIDELVVITTWGVSCKTPEQLANVKRFTKSYKERIAEFGTSYPREAYRVLYHLGVVEGIQLALGKLKFKIKE